MTTREQENRARANINSWRRSTYYELWDAYGRCSSRKKAAWDYCKNLCAKLDGTGLKVISRNSHIFTAGFEYTDKETGEVMFMYISPNYDRAVSMSSDGLGLK